MFFNLGPLEVVAIFVVALLVFGPEKLPEIGRQVGKAVREFRKFQAYLESNVRDAIDPVETQAPPTRNGHMPDESGKPSPGHPSSSGEAAVSPPRPTDPEFR